MVFLFWLILHVCYIAASGAIVGPRQNAKPSRADVAIILLWYVIPLSWLIDRGHSSSGLFAVGLIAYGLGAALVTAARKVNPWFSPKICRPPYVVRFGPYHFLSHPGYAGMSLMGIGSCAMLGGAGIISLLVYIVTLKIRAIREDHLISTLKPDVLASSETTAFVVR